MNINENIVNIMLSGKLTLPSSYMTIDNEFTVTNSGISFSEHKSKHRINDKVDIKHPELFNIY